jgi:hypothetical protein
LTDKKIHPKNWNFFLRGAGATAAILDSPLDKPEFLLDGVYIIIIISNGKLFFNFLNYILCINNCHKVYATKKIKLFGKI